MIINYQVCSVEMSGILAQSLYGMCTDGIIGQNEWDAILSINTLQHTSSNRDKGTLLASIIVQHLNVLVLVLCLSRAQINMRPINAKSAFLYATHKIYTKANCLPHDITVPDMHLRVHVHKHLKCIFFVRSAS